MFKLFTLMGHYIVYVGSCLPTFQDSLSVTSSSVIQSTKNARNKWKCGYIRDGVPVDDLGLKTPGVYSNPFKCSQVYTGQTG